MNHFPFLLAGILSVLLASPSALSQSPENGDLDTATLRGLAISTEADQRDSGWQDVSSELEMTLVSPSGKTAIRRMRALNLEVAGDGDKSLSVFDEPRDVRGTAVLSWSHALAPDDQWLYLPALGRTKRISTRTKSGPFMGSDFAYEDIASQEVEKYSHKFIREERLEEFDCYVVERRPKYRFSGYTRMLVWIDKVHYRTVQVEYYDRKSAKLKTLTAGAFKLYNERYWRAESLTMFNHQTGRSTRLAWRNREFSTGLTEQDFSKNALGRAR